MAGSGYGRAGAARSVALARRFYLQGEHPAPNSYNPTPLLLRGPSPRRFFSLPNFDEMRARTFSSTKTVQHSPKNLFAVVANVGQYDKFVPFCARSRVVRRYSGKHFEAELEIGFRLFNEKYVSDVTLVDEKSVTAEAIPGADGSTGLFERLVSTWKFAPGAHPDECVVSFDVDFRVASVVHAQAVGLFFGEVSRMQISAFEERCNALYSREGRRAADNAAARAAAADKTEGGRDATKVAAAVVFNHRASAIQAAQTRVQPDRVAAMGIAQATAPAAVLARGPPAGDATDAADARVAQATAAKKYAKVQPWESRVLAAFAEAAEKSTGGWAEDARGLGDIGGHSGGEAGVQAELPSGPGLGLRDFSLACAALAQDGVEPFAVVSSRPLLCGALHVALDVGRGGRVTAEGAVAAAKLLREHGLESGLHAVNEAELKAYLLDQLLLLKRRMPHVARLACASQQQQQQQWVTTGGGASTSSSMGSAIGAAAGKGGDARATRSTGYAQSGGGEGRAEEEEDAIGASGGFEILLETAMADVMVEAALEGADALAEELFGALDADGSGTVTGGEWAAAARGHPDLLSPHTLDGILRLGVLTRLGSLAAPGQAHQHAGGSGGRRV